MIFNIKDLNNECNELDELYKEIEKLEKVLIKFKGDDTNGN